MRSRIGARGRGLGWCGLVGVVGCLGTTVPGPASSIDLRLPDVRGTMITPRVETGEEIFVLAFWATWCQPCQQELAKMNQVHASKSGRGLRIFAVNIDGPDTAAQVGPWVEREGYGFDVLLDRETQVLGRYNPRGDIPYYVVLDAHGRILREHQGYMTGDIEDLDGFLESVLPPAP